MTNEIKFAFLGTGPLAESLLESLFQKNIIPTLVITSPDKKSGRHLELQKNKIADWCQIKNIKYIQNTNLKTQKEFFTEFSNVYQDSENHFDLFIIASYPKILSAEILEIPKFGCLNLHPSLLPKYRGPSPIQSALLNGDTEIGISLMKLDTEMDHGPILIQKEIQISNQDTNLIIEERCGQEGGLMLALILEDYKPWAENHKLTEQNHALATFTKKFIKEDGRINLNDKAIILINKFRALLPHIPIYFIIQHQQKDLRVKITEINLEQNLATEKTAKEIIQKVIPENKSEMSWEDFERGYLQDSRLKI